MKTFLLLTSALCLGGCAATPAAPQTAAPVSLVGTSWVGVVDASVDKNAVPRVEFAAGRLTGFTGCNMMSGEWTGEGAAMRVSGVVATKRMCLGAGDAVEQRVLAAIGGGSRVTREGDKLVFTSPSGVRFEFVRAR